MFFLQTPKQCWIYWGVVLLFGGIVYRKTITDTSKKPKKEELPPPPPPDPEEVYKEKAKKKWLRSFQGITTLSFNQNIESVFYNRKMYEQLMVSENEIERIWKQRILMENTPRGTIIMYFNAYKRGFAYYSDQTIPYSLINAVAMKYVLTYFCRDFFIDEIETKDLILSPFIELYEKDAFQKKQEKSEKGIDIKSGPFLKSKNFVQKNQLQAGANVVSNIGSNKTNTNTEPVKEYVKNRFIYEGKICNFTILQKYKIPLVTTKKKTSAIKYSDFKQWHNPQTSIGESSSMVTSLFCNNL